MTAESDGDESDTDSVTLEESEELFPDLEDEMDKMEEGISSEVDNFDICEIDHHKAFVDWKRSGCFVHTLQLVVKVFETAPAYSRRVNSELAIAKKVNRSCRATVHLMELAGKKLVKKLPKTVFLVIYRMLLVKEHYCNTRVTV